ncbi:hypothetical protein AVEN_22751-1 [Araneus ventricosus]|uniref:Uncharacterized protein n=1 Tax=Araneus ventricosus TaxID=182803 RepID=A0A4Y2V025_ARAVE|nr:hypothetical protein AVEN_22751-1 [Araneus ventricosus]
MPGYAPLKGIMVVAIPRMGSANMLVILRPRRTPRLSRAEMKYRPAWELQFAVGLQVKLKWIYSIRRIVNRKGQEPKELNKEIAPNSEEDLSEQPSLSIKVFSSTL